MHIIKSNINKKKVGNVNICCWFMFWLLYKRRTFSSTLFSLTELWILLCIVYSEKNRYWKIFLFFFASVKSFLSLLAAFFLLLPIVLLLVKHLHSSIVPYNVARSNVNYRSHKLYVHGVHVGETGYGNTNLTGIFTNNT